MHHKKAIKPIKPRNKVMGIRKIKTDKTN